MSKKCCVLLKYNKLSEDVSISRADLQEYSDIYQSKPVSSQEMSEEFIFKFNNLLNFKKPTMHWLFCIIFASVGTVFQ